MNVVTAFLRGFTLYISLLASIGAQNSFMIKKGLSKEHVFLVVALTIICDVLLVLVGVFSFQSLKTVSPLFIQAILVAGIIFLFYYAFKSFSSAFKDKSLTVKTDKTCSAKHSALTAIGFAILNPKALLDTIVIIGSASIAFSGISKMAFAFGAALASALWFIGITVFAVKMRDIFKKPVTWKILDVIVGLICINIGVGMLQSLLKDF